MFSGSELHTDRRIQINFQISIAWIISDPSSRDREGSTVLLCCGSVPGLKTVGGIKTD